ncbi:MAG: hypothetical protein ACE5JU_00140 [Candidatus Binatia bacterium]
MDRLGELERHEQALLQDKFWRLVRWERIKRRERILVSAFFYAVLASLFTLPVGGLFPPWAGPLFLIPPLFLVMTLAFFLRHPWGSRESLRTISLLDKTLHLQERALTAWEILGRKERRPAEHLVLEEAAKNLKVVDTRALFKRQLSWHLFLAPPLLLLWMLLAWLDVGLHLDWVREPKVVSVARKLKEFSHGLHNRAKEDDLTGSLKTARALEEVAEKGLRGEIGEERLREDLTALVHGMGDLGLAGFQESGISLPTLSRQALSDLRAEVGKVKDALKYSNMPVGKGIRGSDILERLASLSPFRGEVENNLLSVEKLSRREVWEFLDRLERGAVTELDRRALKETREFLLLLLKEMEGEKGGRSLHQSREAQLGSLASADMESARGSLPGDQPGTKEQKTQPPSFRARAATHLRGLLGKGLSAGLTLRGEFQARGSEVPQEEIVTSYQRQIEGELASERIPEELKETIKRYFLSLGWTQGKRGGD